MAPTRNELLSYLRQAKINNPQMTKEQLAADALAHFAAKLDKAKPSPEETPIILPASIKLNPEQQMQLVVSAEAPPELENKVPGWLAFKHPALRVALVVLTFFLIVLAGVDLFKPYAPQQPSKQELMAAVAALTDSPPVETGELARFGKRFAGNSAYYDEKYHNKVLEMVGVVEIVERNATGDLQATLLLVDRQNTVFRARFRFLPEQQEVIQLASGTVAVLKGKYVGYSDKVMQFYPSVIVYNSVQPAN